MQVVISFGSNEGERVPPMVTSDGGKPFPVQEQILSQDGNGRSLDLRGNTETREMVIRWTRKRTSTKLGL